MKHAKNRRRIFLLTHLYFTGCFLLFYIILTDNSVQLHTQKSFLCVNTSVNEQAFPKPVKSPELRKYILVLKLFRF